MKNSKQFPFDRARRVSPREVEAARKAIEEMEGKPRPKRRGRPPKATNEKYIAISIRLHPFALAWLKKESKKRGTAYQSLVNEILMAQIQR